MIVDLAIPPAPLETGNSITPIAEENGQTSALHAEIVEVMALLLAMIRFDEVTAFDRIVPELRRRLSLETREAMAFALLRSLNAEDAEAVAQRFIEEHARPLPVFLDLIAEAESWAALADINSLRAHVWAAWKRLPDARRRAFLEAATASLSATETA